MKCVRVSSSFYFYLFLSKKKEAVLNAIAIYRHEIAATKIFEARFMIHAAVVNQMTIFLIFGNCCEISQILLTHANFTAHRPLALFLSAGMANFPSQVRAEI